MLERLMTYEEQREARINKALDAVGSIWEGFDWLDTDLDAIHEDLKALRELREKELALLEKALLQKHNDH